MTIKLLKTLDFIFSKMKDMSRDPNPYITILAEDNFFPVIEDLQTHPNDDVYNAVSTLIDNHMCFEVIEHS